MGGGESEKKKAKSLKTKQEKSHPYLPSTKIGHFKLQSTPEEDTYSAESDGPCSSPIPNNRAILKWLTIFLWTSYKINARYFLLSEL